MFIYDSCKVRIFFQLVNNPAKNVDPKNIAILSQYRAQRSSIEEQLKSFGFTNPKVSTVIASQGKCRQNICYVNFRYDNVDVNI